MRVKELREEHGWSMRDLAREAGVSLDTVQAMEHGSRPHRPSSVKKVADALGASVRELRGESTVTLRLEDVPQGMLTSLISTKDSM